MTNRRMDALYLALFVAVSAVGYFVANRAPEEVGSIDLSSFEPPDLELEVPFEFPYTIMRFKEREAPKLRLSGNMESVLVEVRSALLESSTTENVEVEVQRTEQLAALD